MDRSLTAWHMRYLWSVGKFYCNELFCRNFTNAKAFVLSGVGVFGFSYASEYCPPNFVYIFDIAYLLSLSGLFFESVGILVRSVDYYVNYLHDSHKCYTFTCAVCEARRQKLKE